MDDAREPLDLIIIGGGPAGMSAALVAGRARLRTLVLNEEAPRNAVSHASHGLYTRDGAHASELLEVSKAQLAKYPSVHYRKARATAVQRSADSFTVTTPDGDWIARRLILATGFRDHLSRLEIPGIEDVYGTTAFPCPFCDGFEFADKRWAVVMAEGIDMFAKVLRIWSEDLHVFTHGQPLPQPILDELADHDIPVHQGRIQAVHSTDHRLQTIELEDGTTVERDVAFIGEEFAEPSVPFAAQLGLPPGTNHFGAPGYDTEERGKTTVDGLYLVGDAHRNFGGLMAAAYDGATCVQHIVHELSQERW